MAANGAQLAAKIISGGGSISWRSRRRRKPQLWRKLAKSSAAMAAQ